MAMLLKGLRTYTSSTAQRSLQRRTVKGQRSPSPLSPSYLMMTSQNSVELGPKQSLQMSGPHLPNNSFYPNALPKTVG